MNSLKKKERKGKKIPTTPGVSSNRPEHRQEQEGKILASR